MAQRTPLRHKQASLALPGLAGPLKALRDVNSPRTNNAVAGSERKRKQPSEVVNLCTTSEQVPTKLSSPAVKRIKREPTPAAPLLERGKKVKARKEKDEALREGVSQHREQWQRKYRHAFPKFVFYFDALDGAKRDELALMLQALGSTVESFFSKSITHVVTSRPVPSEIPGAVVIDVDAEKENQAVAPLPVKPMLPSKLRSPLKVGTAEGQDVLSKAHALGIKIWDQKKTLRIVNELLDADSPHKPAAPAKALSLPKLLREEQLSGMTRERDPEVLRHDYNYFSSKSYFVLIEDSTAMHRPIMVKEYAKPRKAEEPEWPVLYGGSEGRPAFCRPPGGQMAPPPPAVPLPLGPKNRLGNLNLRRAVSLNQLQKRVFGGDAQPQESAMASMQSGAYHRHEASGFLAASGNSMGIGSHIASVTSGAPAMPAAPPGAVDKRLAMLDKRQFLSKNGRIDSSGLLSHFGVRGPAPMKRSLSVDTGLSRKAREQPAKPGYCENCRSRYDDFKTHVVHRRHRKFAQNPTNWVELDDLLVRIERPLQKEVIQALEANNMLRLDVRNKLRLPVLPGDSAQAMQGVELSSPTSSNRSGSEEED